MNDAVTAAEDIVRGAAAATGQLLDVRELHLKLAAEQLTRAACAAQDALADLYRAAEAYGPLQTEAYHQAATAGLSAPHQPDGTSPFDTAAEPDGLLILHGIAYARFSPAQALLSTLTYVLNETVDLPAGTRVEVRVQGSAWGQ
ncbi:hypothetical protein ABIA35_006008 [Catenulispora sp. MAP12-49]|uniref:hypothetical protein n=1 Tax=Catenulispora sp. MAP12-49 TaxID=3156302 RepID=UPI0035175524